MKMFRVHKEEDDYCWIDLDRIEAVYIEWQEKTGVSVFISGYEHFIPEKYMDSFLLEFEKMEINKEE